MADRVNRSLRIGDVFGLYSVQADGTVIGHRFGEVPVSVRLKKHGEIPQYRDGLFELHVLKTFSNKMRYLDAKIRRGSISNRSGASSTTSESMSELKAAMKRETQENELRQSQAIGTNVFYGQIVEIQHKRSGLFLNVDGRITAIGNPSALAVALGDEDESSWWKILPKFKMRQEGEKVHTAEQVLFQHLKTGHLLSVGSKTLDMDLAGTAHLEVNADTVSAGLRVDFFRSNLEQYAPRESLILGAEIGRLLNKESEGVLALNSRDGQFYMTKTLDHTNAMWSVEHEDTMVGRAFKWKDRVRLFHVGLGKYLTVDDTAPTVTHDVKTFPLCLKESGEGGVFVLEGTFGNSETEPLDHSNRFRLRHTTTNTYLHTAVRAGHDQIFMCDKVFEEDVLYFLEAEVFDVSSLDSLLGIISPIRAYKAEFEAMRLPSHNVTMAAKRSLASLIFFVHQHQPRDSSANPLTYEDIVDPRRQTIALEQGMIHFILDTIAAPFERTKEMEQKTPTIPIDNIATPEYRHHLENFRRCYRYLKQGIADNDKCTRTLYPYIDFMQFTLGHQMKTADTVMEMFSDSRYMLDRITEPQVQCFVDMIKKSGKMSRDMNFLLALVTCDGEGLPRNQNLVCDKLFGEDLLLHMKINENQLDIDVQSALLNPGPPELISLDEFIDRCLKNSINYSTVERDTDLLSYFERSIQTLGAICLGRNDASIATVSKRFHAKRCLKVVYHARDLALASIKSDQETIDPLSENGVMLGTAFLNLFRTAYLDVSPMQPVSDIRTLHLWDSVDPSLPKASPDAEQAFKNSSEEVRTFVFDWLESITVQRERDTQINQFTLMIIMVLKDLLRFGFLSDVPTLKEVIRLLIGNLDGRNDLAEEGGDRKLVTIGTLPIMKTKEAVMETLEILSDLRSNHRLLQLLSNFKTRFTNGEFVDAVTPMIDAIRQQHEDTLNLSVDATINLDRMRRGSFLQSDSAQVPMTKSAATERSRRSRNPFASARRQFRHWLHRTGEALLGNDSQFQEVFSFLTYRLDSDGSLPKSQTRVVLILQDLTSYDNPSLSAKAFGFLLSYFSFQRQMHNLLKDTILLVETADTVVFTTSNELCISLRSHVKFTMDAADVEAVMQIADAVWKLCSTPADLETKQNRQKLLTHQMIHKTALGLLTLRCPLFTDSPSLQDDAVSAALVILQAVAQNNPTMQQYMFGQLTLIMDTNLLTRLRAVPRALTAIFSGNKDLCSAVTDDLVVSIIETIGLGISSAECCEFLRSVLHVGSIPLPDNQALVLRKLLSDRNTIEFLSHGEAITSPLSVTPEQVNFYSELVRLLAEITDRNHITQAKCEAIVPRSECIAAITNKTIHPKIRIAFVHFFTLSHVLQAPPHTLEENFRISSQVFLELAEKSDFLRSDAAEPLLTLVSAVFASTTSFTVSRSQKALLEPSAKKVVAFGQEVVRMPLLSDQKKSKAPISARSRANVTKSLRYQGSPTGTTTSTELEMNLLEGEPVSKEIAVLLHGIVFHIVQADILNIPSETVDTLCPGLSEKMKQAMQPQAAVEDGDMEIQLSFSEFKRRFGQDLGFVPGVDENEQLTPEEMDLMQLFMDDGLVGDKGQAIKTTDMPSTLSEDYLDRWGPKNQLTMNLIQLLRTSDYLPVHVKRIALMVLKNQALYEDEALNVTKAQSQRRLDKLGEFFNASSSSNVSTKYCGATRMVLNMISDPRHQDVLPQILQFGNALMDGGNKKVQERVFDFMTKSNNRDAFFKKFKYVIQDSISKIRDQHFGVSQIVKDTSSPDFLVLMSEVESTVCIDDLLRFIQQTCEGHFLPCQQYWQEQTNASKSYNIIGEVVEFVAAMIRLGINIVTIRFVLQAFDTLIETVQGPCTENQVYIASSAVPGLCIDILEQESFPGCDGEHQSLVADLKEKCALLMSSLLEGCMDSKIPKLLIHKINFDRLMRMLRDVYIYKIEVEKENNPTKEKLLEEKMQTAFEIFILVRRLAEFDPDTAQQLDKRITSTSRSISREEKDTIKFFMHNTASIEINQRGELQRVVFRVPEVCRYLSNSTKEELMHSVDRSTPGTKLTGVLDSMRDIHYEMVQQLNLKGNPLLKLQTYEHVIRRATFIVAFALNIIMLATWKLNDDGNPEFSEDWVDRTVFGLGIVATIGAGITLFLYLFQHGRVYIRKQLREVMGYSDLELKKEGNNPKIVVLSAYFLATSNAVGFEMLRLAFGVTGLVYHRFFFCVFLLDIVNLNLQLRGVTRSITSNGTSLILTGVLIAVVIYIYAGVGFHSFSSEFVDSQGAALCTTLWQCTIVSLNGGLRSGDIGGVMDGREWGGVGMIFFKFTFFVVVVLLLLNVITGIVLDTFAELRQEAIDIEESLTNYCFVCSIDRQTFDRFGDGFDTHIKKDHSLWKYVYFIINTVYFKDTTSYTGPESFVASMVREQNVDFFPISQAIVLKESQDRKNKDKEAMEKSLQNTRDVVQRLANKVEAISEQLKKLPEAVIEVLPRQTNNQPPATTTTTATQ